MEFGDMLFRNKKKCASLVECVKRYKGRIVMYLKKLIYRKTMQ